MPWPLGVAAAICASTLFCAGKTACAFYEGAGGLAAKWTYSACLVLAPLATYFGWAQHMAMTLGVSRSNLGGDRNIGPVQLFAHRPWQLFGIGRTERFSA